MTIIFFMGVIGILFILIFKNNIFELVGRNDGLVNKLADASWFQSHWLSGIFLFLLNLVLFFSTCAILYILTYFTIPFFHILIMFLAVVVSVLLWVLINNAWKGTKRNRLKMGAIGSSFYFFMAIFFVYQLVTLKPAFHGDDTFMAAVGLVLAIIVTTVAFTTCIIFVSFSKKGVS